MVNQIGLGIFIGCLTAFATIIIAQQRGMIQLGRLESSSMSRESLEVGEIRRALATRSQFRMIRMIIGLLIAFSFAMYVNTQEIGRVQSRTLYGESGLVSSTTFKIWSKTKYQGYIPSSSERFIMDHLDQLGYDSEKDPIVCSIWDDPKATTAEIHNSLVIYDDDLDRYTKAVEQFQPVNIDILKHIQKNGTQDVCDTLKLHTDGLSGIFLSNQLSLSKSGWIEPLTPPFRHHKLCNPSKRESGKYVMSLDYLVHDFEVMCRNLQPTSQKVFIDMGASLTVHKEGAPTISLLNLYEKFGFHFDHIYAFEIKFTQPGDVFAKLLPEKYFASYHWINTGVTSEKGHKLNPLKSILQKFSEDDFIVVKLDIDTSSIEVPLTEQLLEGGPGGIYHKLVDQFYFEHHVHFREMAYYWGSMMNGTVKQSLEMFYGLREKGIPAHYWP